MKNLEAIRKMDNFEKRLSDITKDYAKFKAEIKQGSVKNKSKTKK